MISPVRRRLPSMPLWDPNIGGGRPLLADQQSAAFSPFSLPTYVLPYLWSLSLVAALKILAACLGGRLVTIVLLWSLALVYSAAAWKEPARP